MMKQYVQELEKRKNPEKRQYLKNLLADWKVSFQTQKFKTFFQRGENIIVDYPFGQPASPNAKKVLLTAHYDAVFWSPGANDNGSAVAVLLELINRLKNRPVLPTALRFVFFDLEDTQPSLSGSRAYIQNFGVDDIEKVYNLEMVGMGEVLMLWPSEEKDAQDGWLKTIADSARRQNFSLFHLPAKRVALIKFPAERGFVSDHIPFVESGCQACSLTVLPKEDLRFAHILKGEQRLKFVFNLLKYNFFAEKADIPKILRHYHNKNDRSEFISEATLQKVANVLQGAVFAG